MNTSTSSKPSSNSVVALFTRMSRWPLGKWLFSRAVCFKAPYFGSISPRFIELRSGYASVLLRKRRSVTNHIGTIHAIAMANACELAAGTLTEATIPRSMRWIPKGMTIHYQSKAETDVIATAIIEHQFDEKATIDLVVPVSVKDKAGTEVVRADITMYVSPKQR